MCNGTFGTSHVDIQFKIKLFSPPVHMHSFLVLLQFNIFYSFAGPVLEKHNLFSIFEFLFSENRKKILESGSF